MRDWVPIAASYPAEGYPCGQVSTNGPPLIQSVCALLTVRSQNIPSTMSVSGIKVRKRSLVRKVETAVDCLFYLLPLTPNTLSDNLYYSGRRDVNYLYLSSLTCFWGVAF